MKRIRLVLPAAGALALLAPLSAQAATPTLSGVVGPGFTITLKQGGKAVKQLAAGKYTFSIQDKSGSHNFHLKGPGVEKKTDVGKTGSTTWTLTVKKGTYKFLCDPHASAMNGSFKVN